jgi:hypothetical protein
MVKEEVKKSGEGDGIYKSGGHANRQPDSPPCTSQEFWLDVSLQPCVHGLRFVEILAGGE